MQAWKTLRSVILVDDAWLRLRADSCELPNGIVLAPYYVVEERDWVHIVAVSGAGSILTVRQYRYAGDAVCLELPAGICDPGEGPEAAARRELREETGHTARSWIRLASLWANPARQTNKLHVFLALGLEDSGSQTLDATEDLVWGFHSVDEIKEAIRSGEFGQSLHVASFYLGLEALIRS
jgi:8-oxo-dGTP pyrophosphatase MutT (NUDIX family)